MFDYINIGIASNEIVHKIIPLRYVKEKIILKLPMWLLKGPLMAMGALMDAAP